LNTPEADTLRYRFAREAAVNRTTGGRGGPAKATTYPTPRPVRIPLSVRSLPDAVSRCPRCERLLPESEFARDRPKASGHRSHCKGCDNAKSKRYYAANRERVLAKRAARTAELREAGFQVRRGWSKWRAV
jgi:hypothetical protein